MAKTSNTMLNKSGESESTCLFLILEEKLAAITYWVWFYLWVWYMWPLLYWDTFTLHSLHWDLFFNYQWMWNFVKCILCIYWSDHFIFIFRFVNVMYHIDWFTDVELTLHPGSKSQLIMLCEPFNVLLDVVC